MDRGSSCEVITYNCCSFTAADSSRGLSGHDGQRSRGSRGKFLEQTNLGEEPCVQLETVEGHTECFSPVSSEGVCHVLGEFAEWEIRWEDLQIGERIGIGQILYFLSVSKSWKSLANL